MSTATEELDLTVSLTEAEARHLARAVARRRGTGAVSPLFYLGLVLGVPLVGLSILAAIGVGLIARVEARSVVIAAALAYFAGFFIAQLQVWRMRRAGRAVPALPATFRVAVSEEGVAVRSGAVERRYGWGGVAGAEIDGPLLMIRTADGEAVAIPLRLLGAGVAEGLRERIDRKPPT